MSVCTVGERKEVGRYHYSKQWRKLRGEVKCKGGLESNLDWQSGNSSGGLGRNILGNRELSREAAMTVHNAVVAPALVCEYEACMGAAGEDWMRLQAAERISERILVLQ